METRRFTLASGRSFTFTNSFHSTRSGFRHETALYGVEKLPPVLAKCCYLNRTWECYTYQSVMLSAVDNAFELLLSDLVDACLTGNDRVRLPKGGRDEIKRQAELGNKEWQDLVELRELVRGKVW